jgi:hypothetical protein
MADMAERITDIGPPKYDEMWPQILKTTTASGFITISWSPVS